MGLIPCPSAEDINMITMKSHIRFASILAATLIAAVGTTACSDAGSTEPVGPDSELVEIDLNGNISHSEIPEGTSVGAVSRPESRSVINATHGELSLSFVRLDMDTDGNYPATGYASVSAALSATLAKSEDGKPSAITFNPTEFSLAGGDASKGKTKLVGWYPAVSTGASSSVTYAGGVVTLNIDGESDIMLSGELEGSKTNKFGSASFEHKLTQVKILAYAVSDAAKTRWGKIKNIKLKDQVPTCKITLPSTVAWDGTPAALELVKKEVATDKDITYDFELGVATIDESGKVTAKNEKECGYAMLKPVEAGTKLSLELEMADGRKENLTVDWVKGYEAGKSYAITLRFTVAEIEFEARIVDWITHEWPSGDDDFKGEIEI